MHNGDKDPQEIIASVKHGLLRSQFWRRASGHHQRQIRVFHCEAYMIEDGKITYPVKGATLIGNGPDALTRVSMIGNDMALIPVSAPAARKDKVCRSVSGSPPCALMA